LAKARWVKDKYGYDCFSDDTGLEVDALDGAPGVYSARYAGPGCTPHDNVQLLLKNMQGVPFDKRTARFTTVIALIIGDDVHYFRGTVEGHILETADGNGGFGYDPVFQPQGWDKSFAQASPEQKNAISHRGRATRALLDYLLNK
jgi:XTP/dITP diphosphohydrolase